MKLLLILLILGNTNAQKERQGGVRNSPKTFGNVYADGYAPEGAAVDHSDPLVDLANPPLMPKQSQRPYIDDEDTDIYNDPRDESLLRKEAPKESVNDADKPIEFFDFPSLLEFNIMANNERKSRGRLQRPKTKHIDPFEEKKKHIFKQEGSLKEQHFAPTRFDVNTDTYVNQDYVKVQDNWTTCDEFGREASFHPADIVGVEWVPFFIWSYSDLTSVAKVFSYPTKKLVKEFRLKYPMFEDKNIDWDQHKLVMRDCRMEMLLIAVDRTGLFYGLRKTTIPDIITPEKAKYLVKMPVLLMRIKIVDPYLALMHCDPEEPYAAIMAPAGQEPVIRDEAKEEAAILGFQGVGLPVRRNVELEAIQEQTKLSKLRAAAQNNTFFEVPDSVKKEPWGPSVVEGRG